MQSRFLPENICKNIEAHAGSLPVFEHLPKIAENLAQSPSRRLLLSAQTGAGKSTTVPFALLNQFNQKVIMLQPRRLAVLAVANYCAFLSGGKTGEFCGYRIKNETCVSSQTRLEVMTEGLFLRILQQDPALEGVSCVILDEFHERSIYADLILAFLKEVQSLRDDLYVLVMSASINKTQLCTYLQCPDYDVPGRLFDVELEYLGDENTSFPGGKPAVNFELLKKAVYKALSNPGSGSVLAFLPGIADIRRAQNELGDILVAFSDVETFVLHSSVDFSQQKNVLAGSKNGKRRLILSSAVAETSLTVPGVATVIDCGLSRQSIFDPNTGMNRLCTRIESEFSAIQRKGRAGRTQNGKCFCLWNQFDPRQKDHFCEILHSDLCALVLECAQWGAFSIDSVDWLTRPPAGAWQVAVDFLCKTGLIESSANSAPGNFGKITRLGKTVLQMGLHPRIALVALVNSPVAIEYAVKYSGAANPAEEEKTRADLQRRIKNTQIRVDQNLAAEQVLLAGFFDRLAMHCGNGLYKFAGGRQASFLQKDAAHFADGNFPQWIIAPEVDAGEKEGKIYRFEVVKNIEALNQWLLPRKTEKTEIVFDGNLKENGKIKKYRRTYFEKLLLGEQLLPLDEADRKSAYCSFVQKNGVENLPWNDESRSFYKRALFFALHAPDGGEFFSFLSAPDTAIIGGAQNIAGAQDDAQQIDRLIKTELLQSLEQWLLPFWVGASLSEASFLQALRYKLNGDLVDKSAPKRLKLSNGKEVPVKYEENDKTFGPEPAIEIIIQQIFGVMQSPAICGIKVTLKLLSPARRPLQVTKDLENFWANTWPQICKEMKGRYPKHNWDYRIAD